MEQRATAAQTAVRHRLRVAVHLDDPVTRGIATAFRWLGVGIHVFAPADLDRAFEALHLTNGTRPGPKEVLATWDLLVGRTPS